MAGIVKYTEEELRGYSVAAVVPEGIDLTGFAEIVRSDKLEGEEYVVLCEVPPQEALIF